MTTMAIHLTPISKVLAMGLLRANMGLLGDSMDSRNSRCTTSRARRRQEGTTRTTGDNKEAGVVVFSRVFVLV